MFAASAAAEALLFPVGAHVFSRVTFAGLALNFLAIPLMARRADRRHGGRAAVRSSRDRSAAVAGWIAHVGAAGLVRSADLVRFAPARHLARRAAVVDRWSPSTTRRSRSHGGDGVVASTVGTPRRRVGARDSRGCVAAARRVWILAEPWTLVAQRGDGRLHVTFIDVGQGDAAFVRLSRRDRRCSSTPAASSAASSFDIGDRVVAPVLRDAGRPAARLRRAHARRSRSHRRRGVDRARVPAARGLGRHSGAAIRAADGACASAAQVGGARWANVYARRSRSTIDDVEVIARHPDAAGLGAAEGPERRLARPRAAVARRVGRADRRHRHGGRARHRVSDFRPRALRVVKVPHHGSLTSSTPEFVAALRPTSRSSAPAAAITSAIRRRRSSSATEQSARRSSGPIGTAR